MRSWEGARLICGGARSKGPARARQQGTRDLRCRGWSGVAQQVEQRGHAGVHGCGCDRRRARGCSLDAFRARPIGHRRRRRLRLFLFDLHTACERRRPVGGIPDHRRREFQEGEGVRPAGVAGDGSLPDRLAIRCRLHDAVILQHVEHRRIARRDAVDALRQQMCAQLVGDGLAHQPQGVLGQPTVRRAALVQLEFFLEQVAQAVEQFALQRMLSAASAWDRRRVPGRPMPGRPARPVRRACRHARTGRPARTAVRPRGRDSRRASRRCPDREGARRAARWRRCAGGTHAPFGNGSGRAFAAGRARDARRCRRHARRADRRQSCRCRAAGPRRPCLQSGLGLGCLCLWRDARRQQV